jgi:hypothetical protein
LIEHRQAMIDVGEGMIMTLWFVIAINQALMNRCASVCRTLDQAALP